jgi:hypothetical protein
VFASFLDRLGDGVIEAAAAGTDMLLTAFGPAPLSRLVAEGFGIPSVGAYLAPAVPTQEFPPPGWPGTSVWRAKTRCVAVDQVFLWLS